MKRLALAALLLFGSASFAKKPSLFSRSGPRLVPVVVASMDIPAGTLLTFDLLSQRQVEEQFVTSSFVKPDSVAHAVNQPLLAPVLAGEPLLWQYFELSATGSRGHQLVARNQADARKHVARLKRAILARRSAKP